MEPRTSPVAARVADWRHAPDETRKLTRAWFRERRTALLRLPPVIMPDAFNYLLNPLHLETARIAIVARQRVEFDVRLFGIRPPGGR